MHTNSVRGWIFALVGLGCLCSVSGASDARTRLPTGPQAGVHRLAHAHALPIALPPTSMVSRAPQNASPDIVWVECPPDAQAYGAVCGMLPVPLNRKYPKGAQIDIYFELYAHTSPGPAVSAILANAGGPGGSTTSLRDYAVTLFAANLGDHDILLIDDRGRGLSGVIDCEELQHGTAPFAQAEADCATQLGNTASRTELVTSRWTPKPCAPHSATTRSTTGEARTVAKT